MDSFWKAAGLRTALTSAAACSAMMAAPAAMAQEQRTFDISSQNTASALNEFSRQAGVQILFPYDVAATANSPALNGAYARTDALNLLIQNTGLELTSDDGRTIVLRASNPTQLGDAGGAPPSEEEIIVTGTRIRGVADQFSPVTQVDRDDMDLAGAATVADVFDALPANFGGGVAPDTATPGSINGPGGAGVNLRGLGNEATLVLLNGRRLAPGGSLGGFVDISAIPVSAIDRVEVLTDGASAIYGTDAIAGVVNIITRDDFSGGETRLGYSAPAEGGETLVVGQTFGWSGQRAHGLITYQYLDQSELDQNDRDFSRGQLPGEHWLLPTTESHSVLATGGAEFTPRVRVEFDAYYNRRESEALFAGETFAVFQTFQAAEAEQYGLAGGVEMELTGEWAADVSIAYARSLFDDFIEGDTTNLAENGSSEIASIDVSFGGPLFWITDEPVELVIGAHTRSESAEYLQVSGGASDGNDDQRRVASGYFELYAPIVGPIDNRPGLHRLAFTAAGRFDDYDDVGSSFDPRLGLAWSPVEGVSFRGTWGTAFRAPRLDQLRELTLAALGVYDDPDAPGGESVALVLAGSRSDLEPEEAETWTVGFDIEPAWLDGLRLRATYFNVAYEGRIAAPAFGFSAAFHFTDFTGAPVRGLSAGQAQAIVDDAASFFNYADFFPIGPLAIADVEVILDARTQNLSRSKVEGFDFELAYSVADWSFALNGTHLTEFTQQASPVTLVDDLLNTFGNPIDLRLRASAAWSTERMTAALYINHVSDYTDDKSIAPTYSIDSWTTFDASLRFDLGRLFGDGEGRGTSLTVSVENLLDEDPPQIGPRAVRMTVYDAANADPSGRRAGILLSTRW